MTVKEFLKPTRKKVIISLELFMILIPLAYLLFIIFPLSVAIIENSLNILTPFSRFFYTFLGSIVSVPLLFKISIWVSISYIGACYISKNKRWFLGIFFSLLIVFIFAWLILYAIGAYNYLFGHSCSTSRDCRWNCGSGPHNKQFIVLDDGTYDCFGQYWPICEKGRCTTLKSWEIMSIEECEQISIPDDRRECIYRVKEKNPSSRG